MTQPINEDDEDTCWECGGELEIVYTCANCTVCECLCCGAEQECDLEDDDDE